MRSFCLVLLPCAVGNNIHYSYIYDIDALLISLMYAYTLKETSTQYQHWYTVNSRNATRPQGVYWWRRSSEKGRGNKWMAAVSHWEMDIEVRRREMKFWTGSGWWRHGGNETDKTGQRKKNKDREINKKGGGGGAVCWFYGAWIESSLIQRQRLSFLLSEHSSYSPGERRRREIDAEIETRDRGSNRETGNICKACLYRAPVFCFVLFC